MVATQLVYTWLEELHLAKKFSQIKSQPGSYTNNHQ